MWPGSEPIVVESAVAWRGFQSISFIATRGPVPTVDFNGIGSAAQGPAADFDRRTDNRRRVLGKIAGGAKPAVRADKKRRTRNDELRASFMTRKNEFIVVEITPPRLAPQ